MKKFLLAFFAMLLLISPTFGQLTTGTMSINADLSIVSNRTERITQNTLYTNELLTSILINPTFEYFVKGNLSVLVGVAYQSETRDIELEVAGADEPVLQINKANTVGVNLQIRQYKMLSTSFGLYGGLRASYGLGKGTFLISSDDPPMVSDFNAYSFSLSPGMVWFFADKFAVDMSIGLISYRYQKTVERESINQTEIKGLNTSLSSSRVTFGFKYFLRR